MAINKQVWPGCTENPCAPLLGMQIGAATMENTMELPQKVKNGTAL